MSHPDPCHQATGPASQLLQEPAAHGTDPHPSPEDYSQLKGAASPGSSWEVTSCLLGDGEPSPLPLGRTESDTVHAPEPQWDQAKAGLVPKPHFHPATSRPTLAPLTAFS